MDLLHSTTGFHLPVFQGDAPYSAIVRYRSALSVIIPTPAVTAARWHSRRRHGIIRRRSHCEPP
jgi:hypothetical protein